MKYVCGIITLVLLITPAVWAADLLTKKVLIIGIDGTMPSALAVANTPNLDALKAEGAFSDRAITHPVTHSAACWSSMFTGVWGDKHGVNDPGNSFSGHQFARYPNFMKRFEQVDSNLNTVAYLRWAPLDTALDGTDEIQAFGSDSAMVIATVNKLTHENPDVFYTILLDVDSAGHSSGWGPDVPNYVQAIETADGRVGQIIQALTNRVTYAEEDWLVILLSDHGKHDDVLELSRITFHLIWGPSAIRGTLYPIPSIVDVCATVLTHMGVPIDPVWNLDARVEGLPRLAAAYETNLLFNGDAEFNSGTNNYSPNRGIAWWWDPDSVSLGMYGAHPEFPSSESPGPADRGSNFFLGGTSSAGTVQTLSVSHLASAIAQGSVTYELAGWFGGAGPENDTARLIIQFRDENGTLLQMVSIGSVTASDRGNITGLLQRSTQGTVPGGTRLISVSLLLQSSSGANTASADNLSLVLHGPVDPVLLISDFEPTAQGWQLGFSSQTNRTYELQRSQDLLFWTTVDGPTAGNGDHLTMTDTDAPAEHAFYRILGLNR